MNELIVELHLSASDALLTTHKTSSTISSIGTFTSFLYLYNSVVSLYKLVHNCRSGNNFKYCTDKKYFANLI